MMKIWSFGLLGVAGVLLSVLGWLYTSQDDIIYPRHIPFKRLSENPRYYRSPGEFGLPYENVELLTEDGVAIYGWLMLQPKS